MHENDLIEPRSDDGRLTDVPRRHFLAMAAGGAALVAGCAAPPPEAPPIDPSSLVYPPPPETPRFYYDRTIWGSNDVVEVTSTDRWRQMATGQGRRGKGFGKPFGVAARDGRVFVSDTVLRTVMAFDFPQKRFYEVGRRGVGSLAKPLGMAIDGAGRLYVMDGTTKRVQIYDLDGNYQDAIVGKELLSRPTDVAVSEDGQRIYVLDTGGVSSRDHRVVIYNPAGSVIDTIGKRGAGPGDFNLPLACTTDRAGNLYVLDTGNFRCQVFSPDGTFIRMFGEAGRFPGQFGHPKGIAVDEEGIIYISDTSFGVLQLFTNEGRILMSMGRRNEQHRPGEFILPAGVAVDSDRRIYAVDQFFRKLEVFRPAAVPEETPIGQPVNVELLA